MPAAKVKRSLDLWENSIAIDFLSGLRRLTELPEELELIRSLILILCAIAALALLIATIGAVLAMITGHERWIELAWLSIAASLLAMVVSELWPKDRNLER